MNPPSVIKSRVSGSYLKIINLKLLGFRNNTSKPSNFPQPTLNKGKVKYPQDYTIVLVGDSMTERLGNSDELRLYLNIYYPDKSFEVLNYGFGATNILSLQDRLEKETFYNRSFQPILNIDFDLIIIESFAHNPLSEFSLELGLQKHEDSLEKALDSIKKSNPRAKILLMATIGPSKSHYAINQVNLSKEKRLEWANERIAYLRNTIEFAKEKNIPMVNVFQKAVDNNESTKLEYISKDDYIHPSPRGVYLISQEIADAIYQMKLLD